MKKVSPVILALFLCTAVCSWIFMPVKSFPDYSDQVPAGYTGHLFILSQDYPKSLPADPMPWTKFDFKTDPLGYLGAVKEYVFEGMEQCDWQVDQNPVRKWYHMPWMHVGRHPRECTYGLTRERSTKPLELGPTQTDPIQNWAVGFFNPVAGYAIGTVWSDPTKPAFNKTDFPEGSVVAKTLFTAATPAEVPWVSGAFERVANINSTGDANSPKALRTVRMIQLDVAVKDKRANATSGWVFMTFVYDASSPEKYAAKKVTPVGLMWGNDPTITPTAVAAGKKLKETYINPGAPQYALKRLGWAGRLNGPVDNSESSCLSCHGTAEWKQLSDIVPAGTESQRLHWFRNLQGKPFDAGQLPLDYDLQMSVAAENFNNPAINAVVPATSNVKDKKLKMGVGTPIDR